MTIIEATVPLVQTPAWAVLERQLIKTMEDAVHPFLAKYTHPDGRLIWRDGLRHSRDGADDFYESFYNWPLLYLLGGGDHLLALGQRQWEATTELMVEYGHVDKEYEIGYDQFHQSESYIYFYLLCMADPTHAENVTRARRFAGFYLNEDPEALNYDPEHKIIKCAHNGSKGPRWLYEEDEEPSYGYSPGMACYGLPYEDLEGIDTPEDLKDPEKGAAHGAGHEGAHDPGRLRHQPARHFADRQCFLPDWRRQIPRLAARIRGCVDRTGRGQWGPVARQRGG